MSKLKTFVINRFNSLGILFFLCIGSLFLLMIRFKVSESFYLLFLVWNLFLAAIPFILSSLLSLEAYSRPIVIFAGILWLLFLPNAPYIVTDLIHLGNSDGILFWYDFFMITTFAFTGIYLYLLTVSDMFLMIEFQLGKWARKISFFIVPFLVGFGIYLGRFLRWNSWDIIQNPSEIFSDITLIILNPMNHPLSLKITIGFGVFLLLAQTLIFKKLKKLISTEPRIID